MSAAPLATEEQLAHLARQVEALRRVQMLSALRDKAVAEMRRLDGGQAPESVPAVVAPERRPARLVPLKEAARSVGKHEDTVRRWAQTDGFGWRVAGRWMVDLDRFTAFLAARQPG